MKRWAVWIVVILAAGGLVWWIVRKKKLNNESSTTPNPDANPAALPDCTFPLVKGSTGRQVRYVQAYLNKRHNQALTPDGIFGEQTYEALLTTKALSYPVYSGQYASVVAPLTGELDAYLKGRGIKL